MRLVEAQSHMLSRPSCLTTCPTAMKPEVAEVMVVTAVVASLPSEVEARGTPKQLCAGVRWCAGC